MHATMITFRVLPGTKEAMAELADKSRSDIEGMQGCKSVTFFVDNDANTFGMFGLWEKEENAEDAINASCIYLQELLVGIAAVLPHCSIFEVYEPKEKPVPVDDEHSSFFANLYDF